MNGVVGTDQEVGPGTCQFVRRREHQLPYSRPVTSLDVLHVLGERVRVHRHFWMRVSAELLGAFDADGAIAQRRAFRRAGHDTDVRRHLSYARARADHWATG